MNLEDLVDELYAAAPEEFVAERARLAKVLRDAGLRAEARTLTKLRKPSLAAWALNQLARRNRRDVDLLLDSGHRLREAQAGLLGGAERDAFEAARGSQREALSRLTATADELLRERGSASASTLSQVGESLRAAAVSPEGRELLARGRFVEPIRTQGFDLLGELAASAPRQVPKRAASREREQRAKAELRAAKTRLREAEREAQRARAEADRLSTEAADATRRAEEAEARVEEAKARLPSGE